MDDDVPPGAGRILPVSEAAATPAAPASEPVLRPPLHPGVVRLAAYCWRLIAIGIVALAVLWLMRRVAVVMFPVVIALFLARALTPVAGWLRRHRFRPGLAALTSMLVFFALVGGLVALAVPSFADELDSVGPTLTQAVDDVEDWVVEDSPINVSRESFDRLRERVGDRFDQLLTRSRDEIASRATLIAEAIAGLVLAMILTFFMIRDGARFATWMTGRVPERHRTRFRRALDAAWVTLAGYLRGATLLGVLEAVIIGVTLWLAGGSLIAPVMLITFMGAYIPLVGAVASGLVAVLVALVTGGTGAAVVVGVVALLVQQFDNDLLAPIIYGRALSLHPVVILLSVVAGGALFGITGTILAVPVVAVGASAAKELRSGRGELIQVTRDHDPAAPGAPPPA